MKIQEKYIEALKGAGKWMTVSEWAEEVSRRYPDLLAKAEEQATNQATETTGLLQIAARISSSVSSGKFGGVIEVDESERPKRVRFLSEVELAKHIAEEKEDDVAPLRRSEIERRDFEKLTSKERYRLEELQSISKQLKSYYGLDFELDHAAALLHPDNPGKHHPDNLQFLLKLHNAKKNNANWPRFSLEEQLNYIDSAIKLQNIVIDRLGFENQTEVLDSLIDRISNVYG
jgi:hypothetical protein